MIKNLLNEMKLTDKITSRSKITFEDLVNAIESLTSERIKNDSDLKKLSKTLNITLSSLTKYIDLAKTKNIIASDGSITNRYKKTVKSNSIKPSGKLSKSLDSRLKKFKSPKVSSNNLFSQQVFKMLSLMDGQSSQAGVKNSLMLTGDPGVGKTSFIRGFAKLVGLPLIPIEAPHITEEHIINIPFMIISGQKVKRDNAVIEIAGNHTLNDDAQTFDIVQAESNLVTKLKAMKNLKMKDKEHMSNVASDKNLRQVFMKYKNLIDSVRKSYNCILFLDEYYRNDNMKIRNILRNILNGRIGNDKIPKGTFIVYASNMEDEGVEDIPMNNDFAELEFKAPDKEQWFKYILNKHTDKNSPSGVELDYKVFNKFYETLIQNDLSTEDPDSEVRSSPRRWEQILLYVNASLPVNNVREAKILMANLEVNFRNYTDGSVSKLYPKVRKMVHELIEETSNISFDGEPISPVEWKDTLAQQIQVKLDLDANTKDTNSETRQYVPVISGEPGIGKTAHASMVADQMDLYFIQIDVSTLTRESTTGIPKASQAIDMDGNLEFDDNDNPVMTTQFSKPELLDLIEKKMSEEIKADEVFPEDERKKGKGKYKFLLLFDELSRADAQVFNAIRKLLLEKSFNEEYDLPPSILTIGALNPVDDGAEELTKHVRDVLDIIPARASWAKTEKYLLSEERPHGLQEKLGFDLNTATIGVTKLLLQQYKTNKYDWRGEHVIKEERLFNLQDAENIIYVSPREITDIVTMSNTNIINRLVNVGLASTLGNDEDEDIDFMSDEDFMKIAEKGVDDTDSARFNLRTNYSEEEFDVFIDAMLVEYREVWASKLSFICKKMELVADNVLSVTTGFIMKNSEIRNQYDAIKTMEVDDVKSISEMFEAYFDNPEDLYDSPHFDNYLNVNFSAPQKLTQEITDFMADKISEASQIPKNITETYETKEGDMKERPKSDGVHLDLYVKYLQYVLVILKVLTKKSEYSSKVSEAQKTGQYLSNLYNSLKSIGIPFQMVAGTYTRFDIPGSDYNFYASASKPMKEIKSILEEFDVI